MNLRILNTSFSVLLLLSFLTSCRNDYNNVLKKEIIKSSSDKVIDEKEYAELKLIVNSHPGYMDFDEVSKNDTLLVKKIRSFLKDTSILIKSPVEKLVKLGSIQFYIETSASMGGYMNGKTEFKDIILQLVGNLKTKFHAIRFIPNTIVDTIKTYTNDDDSYSDDLSKSKFKFEGDSPLHHVFGIISNKVNPDDVSFFVTDGIMSGSNQEIASNRQFNVEQSMFLKTSVQRIFSNLKEKFKGHYCVYVFAFKSKFIGGSKYPYYTYENIKVNNTFTDRPFYLFVFGQSDIVKQVIQKLEKIESFKPQEELHFGDGTIVTGHGVIFKSYLSPEDKRTCQIEQNGNIKCSSTPVKSHPVKFAVGFNLNNLPKYASDISYLNANIRVNGSNGILLKQPVVKIISPPLIQLLDERNHERQNVLSDGCTHYVEIEVDEMFISQDTIHISLMKEVNPWYISWSMEDDRDIKLNKTKQDKTFNFKYLIDGFREAFNTSLDDYYLKVNVIIKNKN